MSGFKPELEQELNRLVSDLFEATTIPFLVKKGFLVELNRILAQNMIKETPFKKNKEEGGK